MQAQHQASIEASLAALKNDPALSKADFANVVKAFAHYPDQGRFLLETNQHNEKLAETLLIFRKKLAEAAAHGKDLDTLAKQLFLHYVINTTGPIQESEGSDPFDVYEAVSHYAELLKVGVSKNADGLPVLRLDEKDLPCPEWGTTPGMSAAWSLRNIGPVINKARYGRTDVIPSFAFGFDENAAHHTLENAMTLADMAHLAYFKPAYIEKQLKAWGYDSFRWVENLETDTQVFVAGKGGHLVVCFRGTSSGKDALVDLNFFKTEAYGGRGKVHRGFHRALDSVWTQVQTAVDELGAKKKLFITGHSLGAALAQLAAHRFALNGYDVAHVYVYGSPRSANKELKAAYNELLEEKTFLHINHKDIVTTVPLELLGFHHLGTAPRSFDTGHVISNMTDVAASVMEEKEAVYDQLDVKTQEDIQQQMYEVEQSIQAATKFLSTDPNQMDFGGYETQFNAGAMDEHCMDQYLFKFACAIVDGEWKRIGKAAGINGE